MSSAYSYTDIDLSGLVGRLPKAWRPYALLMRLDRPKPALLLFYPGLFGIFLPPGVPMDMRVLYALIFLVGAVLMRGAGCIINDIWDRDLDRRVERTRNRPLASGAVTLKGAWTLLSLLVAAGAGLLCALPFICLELSLLALVLAGLYPGAKRVTHFPQAVMGFAFGFSAIMGYAAADGLGMAACPLYGAVICWQTGYDTVYGFQDMKDDAQIGVKSLSLLVYQCPRVCLAGVYGAATLLLGLALWTAKMPIMADYLFIPACASLAWQVLRVDPQNRAGCLRLFKFNTTTGALAGMAFIVARLSG